jgi:hypothetical protein
LPLSINDSGSQAYPFVLSDGLTIYFSTTGHQSFGGYDIFVTRYNLTNDSYLAPNQMNMPFNSPFNDYLMVVDGKRVLVGLHPIVISLQTLFVFILLYLMNE